MESGEIWSEYQQKKVRLLHVGTRPGHFRSITKALAAAEDTDRIEVSGGKYVESIVITKSIELIASEGETPELGYRGTVVAFVGNTKAKLVGIEVLQHDKAHEHSVITVSDGSPYIAECIFPSILVTGSSTPTVINNQISGAALSSGICLRGKSGGVFLHNRVHSHEYYCIDLDNSGVTTFEDNRIWAPESEVKFHNKVTQKNRGLGVILISAKKSGSACEPTFKNNRISDSGEMCILQQPPFCRGEKPLRCTITVANDAGGVFESNDISGGMIGVRISVGCTTKLHSNTISKHDSCGISCDPESLATIEKNKISDCRQTAIHVMGDNFVTANQITGSLTGNGVTISHGSSAIVRENIIEAVTKIGIKVSSKGTPLIQKNEIRESEGPGILLEGSGGIPRVDNNVILDGILHGIVAVNGSHANITSNTVIGTAGAAIATLKRANPTCSSNRLVSCAEGLLCCEYAAGKFTENIIDACNTGLLITKGGNPQILSNQFIKSVENGVRITDEGRGTLRDNNITSSKKCGIDISKFADPLIENNEILTSGEAGIRIHSKGFGTVNNNLISSNVVHGIICTSGSSPTVRRNTLTTCTVGDGIVVVDGGLGTYEKNNLSDLSYSFIVKGKSSNPVISHNVVRNSSKAGFLLSDCCSGLIVKNMISESSTVGILINSSACPTLRGNTIQEKVHGILVTCKGTSPSILKNTITNCGGPAFVVREHAEPVVIDNWFTGNLSDALLIEDHGTGIYQGNDFTGNLVGMAIREYGDPDFSKNTISGSTSAAVEIRKFGKGKITENEICNSAVGLQCSGQTGEAVISKNTIEGNTYGVRCSREGSSAGEKQGLVLITHNNILGSAMANILVELVGYCTVQENTISRAPLGILCRQRGLGLFVGNIIEGHSSCNLRVLSHANPTVTDNKIRNSELGVEVTDQGEGFFKNNEITSNGVQLRVSHKGNPKVISCNMDDSSGSGVLIQHHGCGTYEQNTMCRNAFSGLEIEKESNPIVRNNTITNNSQHGIIVHEFGLGVLEGNTIKGNLQSGIFIRLAGRPSVTSNTISGNENGIFLQRDGYGYITDNTIFGNSVAGISLEGGGDPLIEGNDIYHEPIGIKNRSARAQITKNKIRECRIGLTNEGNTSPDVMNNSFRDNAIACLVGHGGRGCFSENNFTANEIAIEVALGGSPSVSNNNIIGSDSTTRLQQGTGVSIQGGLGCYVNNKFSKLQHGIRLEHEGEACTTLSPTVSPRSPAPNIACISENDFTQNCYGVTCSESSTALISKNTFTKNKCAGVSCRELADPTVVENTFEAEPIGCLIEGLGKGSYSSNILIKNVQGMVVTGHNATPEILYSKFIENSEGIVAEQKSNPTITDCMFDGNKFTGITSQSGSTPSVKNCLFMNHLSLDPSVIVTPRSKPSEGFDDSDPTGVLIQRGSRGTVSSSVFIRNGIGLVIMSHAEPTITGNWILQSNVTGIKTTDYGRGTVCNNNLEENMVDITASLSCETSVKENLLKSPMAVDANENCRAVFSDNSIFGKITIKRNADPCFSDNCITSSGVIIHHDGLGSFSENIFMKMTPSSTDAILEIRGGKPRISSNTFLCLQRAVKIVLGGGQFSQNKFLGCRVGVDVSEGGLPHFSNENTFTGCDKGFIFSGESSGGRIENCDITNSITGITIENMANPSFQSVSVFDSKTAVLITKKGRGSFRDCNIFDNSYCGIIVEAECTPSLYRCRLSSALESGALLREPNAHGNYEDNKIRHQFSPVSQKRPSAKERQDAYKLFTAKTLKKIQADSEKRLSQPSQRAAEISRSLLKILSEWGISKSHTASFIRSPRSRQVSLTRIPSMNAVASIGKLFISKRHASLPTFMLPSKDGFRSPLSPSSSSPKIKSPRLFPPKSPRTPRSPGVSPTRPVRTQTYSSLSRKDKDKIKSPKTADTTATLTPASKTTAADETPNTTLSQQHSSLSSRRVSWSAKKFEQAKTPAAPERKPSQSLLSTSGGRLVRKVSSAKKVITAASTRKSSRISRGSTFHARSSIRKTSSLSRKKPLRGLSPQLRALVEMSDRSESEQEPQPEPNSELNTNHAVEYQTEESNLSVRSNVPTPISPPCLSPTETTIFSWGSPAEILTDRFSPGKPSAVTSKPLRAIGKPAKKQLKVAVERVSEEPPNAFLLSPSSVPLKGVIRIKTPLKEVTVRGPKRGRNIHKETLTSPAATDPTPWSDESDGFNIPTSQRNHSDRGTLQLKANPPPARPTVANSRQDGPRVATTIDKQRTSLDINDGDGESGLAENPSENNEGSIQQTSDHMESADIKESQQLSEHDLMDSESLNNTHPQQQSQESQQQQQTHEADTGSIISSNSVDVVTPPVCDEFGVFSEEVIYDGPQHQPSETEVSPPNREGDNNGHVESHELSSMSDGEQNPLINATVSEPELLDSPGIDSQYLNLSGIPTVPDPCTTSEGLNSSMEKTAEHKQSGIDNSDNTEPVIQNQKTTENEQHDVDNCDTTEPVIQTQKVIEHEHDNSDNSVAVEPADQTQQPTGHEQHSINNSENTELVIQKQKTTKNEQHDIDNSNITEPVIQTQRTTKHEQCDNSDITEPAIHQMSSAKEHNPISNNDPSKTAAKESNEQQCIGLERSKSITLSPFTTQLTPPCITAVSTPTTVASNSPVPYKVVKQDGEMLRAQPGLSAVSAMTYGGDTICTLSTMSGDTVMVQPLPPSSHQNIDDTTSGVVAEQELKSVADDVTQVAAEVVAAPVMVSATEIFPGTRSEREARKHLETLLLLRKKATNTDIEDIDCLLPSLGPPEAHPHLKAAPSQPKSFPLRPRQQRLSSAGVGTSRHAHWVRTLEVGPAPSPPPIPPPIKHPKPINLGTLARTLKTTKVWTAANQGIGLRKRPYTARP